MKTINIICLLFQGAILIWEQQSIIAQTNDIKQFYEKSPEPKDIVFVKEDYPLHRFDMYNYFGEKPDILINYFKKYLN